MFKLVTGSAVVALALLWGCAASPPPGGDASRRLAPADSIRDAADDEIFLALYAGVLRRLSEETPAPERQVALMEAQAVLAAAEEMYLEGRVAIALKLLHEADELLRRAP